MSPSSEAPGQDLSVPLTTAVWIARLNWLKQFPEAQAQLRAICAVERHLPSGERFLTTIPIHVCRRCGEEFSEDDLLRPPVAERP